SLASAASFWCRSMNPLMASNSASRPDDDAWPDRSIWPAAAASTIRRKSGATRARSAAVAKSEFDASFLSARMPDWGPLKPTASTAFTVSPAAGESSSLVSSDGVEADDCLVRRGAVGHAWEIQWIVKLAAVVAAYFFHLSRSALLPSSCCP